MKVAEESLSAAFSAGDPYQTVGAAAWPIRALIERGQEQKVLGLTRCLLEVSGHIPNPVGKLKALYLLWQSVYPAGGSASKQVFDKLIGACLSANSWQAGYTMREIILVVARENRSEADQLVALMPEGVYKRQTQHRFSEGKQGHIRQFFWHSG